ncbi:MAG TPA: xanthine dehydrogenase family protein molybdopterin-binding subunit [Nitrolancea sp.]|nr:xanthine dehydrogenase family protein molybdopterin-binding subunit [Nitrolancea sp.]
MESDERFDIVGRRLRRPDSGPRLTGDERYTDDLALPGMYVACLVLSPYAHAVIRGIDIEEATKAPGVIAVVTSQDLPEFARDDEPSERSRFFLATERVSYVGEPVAVVVARSAAEAELAAELVAIEYDPLPPISGIEMARQPLAMPVRPRTRAQLAVSDATKRDAPNVNGAIRHQRGDVERAFREATICVEHTFDSYAVYQSYLEPRSVLASAEPNGRLTIYTPTQGQFMVRSALARVLGLPETEIRIEPMTVGGGFGGKMVLLEPLAAILALRFKRPVKLTLTRQQDFLSTTPAPESRLTVGLAADADGLLTGLRADLWFDTGYFSNSPYQLVAQMIGSYYRIPNLDIRSAEVLTNRTGTGAYRAPGLTPMMFALETVVDELAQSFNFSPLEFRLRNVASEGDLMADGTRWPSMDLKALLQEASHSPLWRTPRAPDEGIGIALGGLRGGAESASASMRLNADGTFSVMVGSVDLTGTNTGLTQIAAEGFGIAPEQIRVTTASSDSAPQFGLTGGSKVLYSVGNAVLEAARDARAQAMAVAADRLEAAVDDLDVVGNQIQVHGAPDRFVTLAQVHALTIAQGSHLAPIFGRGNVANPQKAPAMSVHLARVKVDRETGEVRLTGYDAIHDVGRAINPAEVEAQIHGGVAQGFGWGLREALIYDDHGQLLTGSFMDYAIPKAADLPTINTNLVENPAPFGPFGAKGVGEAPVVAPAAAIANAITDATGIRLRQLPITPERVWRALIGAQDDRA